MKIIRPLVLCAVICIAICPGAGFAQNAKVNTKNEQLIRSYYAAYEKKDWHILEAVLANGFTFTSPAGDDHINLEVYKQRCWPNSANTKRFDIQYILIDGDNAFVCYNGVTNTDKIFRNTERFKFKDGKIIENECFFGTGINFPNSGK